jgi:phenylacetyl-CoA:acceptor oxidoreductase
VEGFPEEAVITTKVPEYCYQCVAGPDLLNVVVENGAATCVEPNWKFGDIHPAAGRVCVKAYGLIQKTYNPYRVKKPMLRTNPRKGKGEDPGWVEITWDEALDRVAQRLLAVRAKGLRDEVGYPRLAVTFGSGGIAPAYTGTLPAFLATWGPVDFGIGSGQGVKCYHSEHLYGEFWHRAFTVQSDTPRTKYLISFGNNNDASGGVLGVWRHAEARANGLKRVQFEPHLSVTGAHAEWVPIKPKTDAAVLFAMLHAILHERDWREVCDLQFLKNMTNSPYLVGPDGYFIRDAESRKPLMWDAKENRARPFDDGFEPALTGTYRVAGLQVGPDGVVVEHKDAAVEPAFQKMIEHVLEYTPEWAEEISGVPATTIRRVADEFVGHAHVGESIVIDGKTFPYRPVAILLGKTVTNGWGGYECLWARTVLTTLVGGLEVPGGTIGTTVRLNRPGHDRLASARPGPDGFMDQPLNPTDKQNWQSKPKIRNAYQTLVPLANNSPWSAALGPAHLPWLFMKDPPDHWPRPTPPDVWIIYRTNPAISHWDPDTVTEEMAKFPFIVAFAYTPDETNWYADVLLPEATDLESLQLYRIGGTKYIEQYWKHQGYALRQPAVETPRGGVSTNAVAAADTMDLTDIATELARRTGVLNEYIAALNKGAGTGVALTGEAPAGRPYDYSLPNDLAPSTEEIWDRVCRAATRSMSEGKEEHDLAWYKQHGAFFVPFPEKGWFLHTAMQAKGLRYELPYQERIWRAGSELGNRLHEQGITWWDTQLREYQPLPVWKDFPDIWARIAEAFDKRPDDYDLWLLTSRSMQYSWGSNVGIPILADVAKHVKGHFGVMLNAQTAKRLGIKDDDWVWIESPLKRVKGHAILRQGIRPDVAVTLQQFGHWVTPVAKDLQMPNLNQLSPLHLALTDATGSGADVVRVRIYKA